ncbi:LIM zinc-binding domain-containing protein [Balamuthia mandrillaris]
MGKEKVTKKEWKTAAGKTNPGKKKRDESSTPQKERKKHSHSRSTIEKPTHKKEEERLKKGKKKSSSHIHHHSHSSKKDREASPAADESSTEHHWKDAAPSKEQQNKENCGERKLKQESHHRHHHKEKAKEEVTDTDAKKATPEKVRRSSSKERVVKKKLKNDDKDQKKTRKKKQTEEDKSAATQHKKTVKNEDEEKKVKKRRKKTAPASGEAKIDKGARKKKAEPEKEKKKVKKNEHHSHHKHKRSEKKQRIDEAAVAKGGDDQTVEEEKNETAKDEVASLQSEKVEDQTVELREEPKEVEAGGEAGETQSDKEAEKEDEEDKEEEEEEAQTQTPAQPGGGGGGGGEEEEQVEAQTQQQEEGVEKAPHTNASVLTKQEETSSKEPALAEHEENEHAEQQMERDRIEEEGYASEPSVEKEHALNEAIDVEEQQEEPKDDQEAEKRGREADEVVPQGKVAVSNGEQQNEEFQNQLHEESREEEPKIEAKNDEQEPLTFEKEELLIEAAPSPDIQMDNEKGEAFGTRGSDEVNCETKEPEVEATPQPAPTSKVPPVNLASVIVNTIDQDMPLTAPSRVISEEPKEEQLEQLPRSISIDSKEAVRRIARKVMSARDSSVANRWQLRMQQKKEEEDATFKNMAAERVNDGIRWMDSQIRVLIKEILRLNTLSSPSSPSPFIPSDNSNDVSTSPDSNASHNDISSSNKSCPDEVPSSPATSAPINSPEGEPNTRKHIAVVSFKLLFDKTVGSMPALSATLSMAKKYGVVDYEGDLLMQGASDHVIISLLKENFEASVLTNGEPPSPRRKYAQPLKQFSMTTELAHAPQKCDGCQKTVYPLERVVANAKVFHRGCFRCCVCNTVMKANSDYCFLNDRFYCVPHYQRLVSEAGGGYAFAGTAANGQK